MKASIIIVSYNNIEHITETINSVKSQSFKDWNCVIIDNGSIDSTFQLAKKLTEDDSRFIILGKKNEGPSAGRNFGFTNLPEKAEFVHFLDGDDILDPEFLKITISYLDSNRKVGLVACQHNIIDNSGTFLNFGHRSRFIPGFLGFPKKLPDSIYKTPFEAFFAATGQGPFAVFRVSIFEQTSGYEEEFWSHEDSDIFCQMALRSEVHYLPQRLYNKRVHRHNLTYSPKANYGLFRKKWDYYKSKDPSINLLIEKSLVYYYSKHKPFRDIKIAVIAFKEFLANKKLTTLKWSFFCVKSGVHDLILRKTLIVIIKKRSLKNLSE